MLWDLVAGAAAGLVGAVLARLLVRDPARKRLRLGITVGLFVLLTGLARELIIKPYRADAALQEVEAFRVLKEREPAAYAAIRAELVRGGFDSATQRTRIQERLAPIAGKYLPLASDAALRRYIAVIVAEIDQLRGRDPILARKFLFPAPGESLDVRPYLDAATIEEDLAALASVIETGAGASPHADDAHRADELLGAVKARVAETHGQDLSLLAAPASPGTDPGKLAAVVADLYREILKLPEADSALVLRKLVAGA